MELWSSSLLSDVATNYTYLLKLTTEDKSQSLVDRFKSFYNTCVSLQKETEKMSLHFSLWIHIHIVKKLFDQIESGEKISQDVIDAKYLESINLIKVGLELAFFEPNEFIG